MKEFTYIIKDNLGIHARPAVMLVKEAEKFKSEITFTTKGKTADAKKIFALMSLAAKQGDEIKVTISGEDEENAQQTIQTFLNNNL